MRKTTGPNRGANDDTTAQYTSRTRVHQQDVEAGPLDLANGHALPLAHLLHKAGPAGVHRALQRVLALLPHGEVVAHVDERVALEEQLRLPHRRRQLRDRELARRDARQTPKLEDERLKHQQRGAVVAWRRRVCEVPGKRSTWRRSVCDEMR